LPNATEHKTGREGQSCKTCVKGSTNSKDVSDEFLKLSQFVESRDVWGQQQSGGLGA